MMTPASYFGPRASRGRYLLIPAMPTPNGRLHLGHIAGPFLKVDVLARHLRRRGDQVRVICGTDSYDSYVGLKAHQTGMTPAAVCEQHHGRILEDLEVLDIRCDVFMNPLSDEWSSAYHDYHTQMLDGLRARGLAVKKRERFLYCEASNRYLVGCWLLGHCPQCRAETAGYFCESCGGHFRPEEMVQPHAVLDEGAAGWREEESWFLELQDARPLRAFLESLPMPEEITRIGTEYLRRQGPVFRLTTPGTWGMTWGQTEGAVPQVVFSAACLFELFCGQVDGMRAETGTNAFRRDSGVTVVSSLGIDSLVSGLIAVPSLALSQPGGKPFDRYLPNYFYTLEGSKFSTSRGHAIWCTDIVQKTPVESDMVRYYLAKVNPEAAPADFVVDHFVATVNDEVIERIYRAASATGERPHSVSAPAESLRQELEERLREQDRALDLDRFRLSEVLPPISAWMRAQARLAGDANATHWWTKGLALLVYPVMPAFGAALWRRLGHDAPPSIESFLEQRPPRETPVAAPVAPITKSSLRACLPATLQSARDPQH